MRHWFVGQKLEGTGPGCQVCPEFDASRSLFFPRPVSLSLANSGIRILAATDGIAGRQITADPALREPIQ